MIDSINKDETVIIIRKAEYDQLIASAKLLDALEFCGVERCDVYEDAVNMLARNDK